MITNETGTPAGKALGGAAQRAGPDQNPTTLDWVSALTSTGPRKEAALLQLHALMLRASRHQIWRMRSQLGSISAEAIDEIVNQSADEAMFTLLGKLNSFEGRSRFTTWAYKFAILQTASDIRRATWRDREVPLSDSTLINDPAATPDQEAEATDLGRALVQAMATCLTPHQRRITKSLLIDLVPADVLAERLGTTRGALYKTLHDSRCRLRGELVAAGYLTQPEPPSQSPKVS